MQEKILTKKIVKQLGLDKVSVITANMLDGYTIIECGAFESCIGLASIEIPNSVTSIGSYAFWRCSKLTSVTIPNSVTSIGYSAFAYCYGLTSITIPNSVTSIGEWAFIACSSLTSVTIPNSVTSIGEKAFCGCSSLVSITVLGIDISVGRHVLAGCFSLKFVIIRDKKYKTQEVLNGKCKAYKAFNSDMTCRGFQYEEGKTYELDGEPKLCEQGFHACLNLADVFNYYMGKINKDIMIHEVELDDVSNERYLDTKVVAKKITIGKRIL